VYPAVSPYVGTCSVHLVTTDLARPNYTAQQVIDRLELAGGYIDHLDVSHNRLNSDGCIHLFQGLGAIRHRQTIDPTSFKLEIRRISVAGNWIGDPVFPAIADYIQGNAALTHLHLQNNGIQVGHTKRDWPSCTSTYRVCRASTT